MSSGSAAATLCTSTLELLCEGARIGGPQMHGQIELALEVLSECIDSNWPEIADYIPQLEALVEVEEFGKRDLVSLLLSKLYYYLGEYEESLKYALESFSGALLDGIGKDDQFCQTILSIAIDKYLASAGASNAKLGNLINDLFQLSIRSGRSLKETVGLAIECSRLDLVGQMLSLDAGLGEVALQLALATSASCRRELLLLLLSRAEPGAFYFRFLCLAALEDVQGTVSLLLSINQQNANEYALLLQIAFDLNQISTFTFRSALLSSLKRQHSGSVSDEICQIIGGSAVATLQLEFLRRQNKSDLQILENSKAALGTSPSHHISTLAFGNAFMHAGTTCDEFLRKNIEYMKHATNWSKFNASTCIGLIHRGNWQNAFQILKDYLPVEGAGESSNTSSPYCEGGALLALGLVFCNAPPSPASEKALEMLKQAVSASAKKEPLIHGACLGSGIIALGSKDASLLEALLAVLFADNAVTGEAAATAIGLLAMGSGDAELFSNLTAYCNETQHEKIKRGISIAIGLLFFELREKAEPFIEQLILGTASGSDAHFRLAAAQAIGLAYAGTANNSALKRLLHFAVDDSSDEVRRVACVSIAFVLCNEPQRVPQVLKLLSQSFNPHTRYGCALGLGIACAGGIASSGKEALELLQPLLKDSTDFVRQAALIGTALVCQLEGGICSAIDNFPTAFRADLAKIISNKYEDTLVKLGAVIAQGLLEAGGRNSSISLSRSIGPLKRLDSASVAGMFLFSHFWHWHSLVPLAGLALKPASFTAVYGTCSSTNECNLQVPKQVALLCSNAPSAFAYPEPLRSSEGTEREALVTAVLSTTHRSSKRAGKAMDIDKVEKEKKAEKDKKDSAQPKEAQAAVPSKFPVSNLARCCPIQQDFCTFQPGEFVPVVDEKTRGGLCNGIVVVVHGEKASVERQTATELKEDQVFYSFKSASKQQEEADNDAKMDEGESDALSKAINAPEPFELMDEDE